MFPALVGVTEVRTRAQHSAFIALPYGLYIGDRYWVPPLRHTESQRWSPAHNAALRTRHVARFLALRAGRVVGRVAAVADAVFAERWEPGTGFFGFFECERDGATARSLLDAAGEALRGWGLARMIGPVNFTTNDEVGLLVDGFDSPPMVLSPYNPRWYEGLLRNAGCVAVRDFHAYGWDDARAHAPAVDRLVRRLRAGLAGVELRATTRARWDEDNRALFALYNAAFADVWGFVPMTWDEYREKAESFRPFYRPELVVFACADGRPVGFALALPNVNEVLARVGGRLLPFGWLTLLRGLGRIRTARAIILGVLPEYRGHGIAALLAHALAEAGRGLGIGRGELSLVQDANEPMRHVIEALGGRRVKTYRLFTRAA